MSIYIHKSHNVSVLLYHIVFPVKYRRSVITEQIDKALKEACLAIADRFQIHFLEIGSDNDHIHFLIQSVPVYAPTKIVRVVKSITAREVFARVPAVKEWLWGGEFWSDGYFVSTVGKHGNETAIIQYVKNQGRQQEYQRFHKDQLKLF